MRHIKNRHATLQKGEAPKNDLLAKFLMEKEENPKVVTDQVVFGMTLSVVNAGSVLVLSHLHFIFQSQPFTLLLQLQ
jgi:hypothetical protein